MKAKIYECPYCAKKFKSVQGRLGHIQFSHPELYSEFKSGDTGIMREAGAVKVSATGPGEVPASSVPGAAPAVTTTQVKELEYKVKIAEAEEKLEAIEERRGNRKQHYADLSEQAGAGPMRPEIASEVQQRLFQTQQQQKQMSLTELLNSPNLPLIIDALKGALGVNAGGGDVSALLKDMGYSLKDLITQATAPKSDGSLKIAGMDLGGVSLTPEVLTGIMEFKAAEEKAKMESETRGRFADQVEGIWKEIAPMIAGKLGQGSPGVAGQGVAGKPPGPEAQLVYCPECQQSYEVGPGNVGETIECQKCGAEIQVTAEQPATKPSRTRRSKQPKPPEKDILFCECGQQLDVTGKDILSEIECPACGKVGKITKPDEPLPAMEPVKKGPETLEERNRRR